MEAGLNKRTICILVGFRTNGKIET